MTYTTTQRVVFWGSIIAALIAASQFGLAITVALVLAWVAGAVHSILYKLADDEGEVNHD